MDEGVCAIRPGTDVGRYARLLARTHDALLSGDRPPVDPRGLVARSWLRVQAQGVDPDRREPPGPLDASQVEQRRARSPLHQVLPELRAALTAVAEDARHVMVVTDADGVLLWREGSTRVRHRADALGFTEGARWTEGAVGTNAIGTALAEGSPVQIFSAEHFVRTHHGWTCTACPVHDPRTGEMLGVVDVSGPAETVHPTTVALVGTAVKLAEASLWRCHEQRLDALRTVAVPVLASGSGPGLVVDDHGWVAAVRGLPQVDRVTAPTADGPVAVHGLGLCIPEPVPGGWLLRPGGKGRSLRLTLELDAHPPRAVVAGTHVWVHPLSTRHAEVLLLLARAGQAGMDAAALSTALYGHVGSLVTIRAEVSRLRKAIGGILLARPYRVAPEVEVVLPDLTTSPFAAASTAPAVRALARA
ncbi:GAF domain-containing protein [Pseudonocardia charpentierae]|uniref:GAF domain-containing protein n=1 Tax=Pseudonocardia charpentierae TaxID=3075545 RepID=A0ABU2N7W6_9PSEU|nr:GAF domain-containing protein [Pseudonocardia sp. DSM 45834]MDT0350042.1 GAF domain-containing protein [Pseudonocardia sp. DSM 45834]